MSTQQRHVPEVGTPVRRVLFVAHSHAFGAFRVGSHHYARMLAGAGVDVVHVSTPVSTAHRLTGRIDRTAARALPIGPHRDADGVRHLIPRTRLPRPYGPFRIDDELDRWGIPLGFDAVLIDQPLLWDASVRDLGRRLVYRPTDLYPSGVKATLQRQILAAADGVVATSGEVLRALGAVSVPTLVVPNGVDPGPFASTDAAERPPVCVYVGAIDERFDGEQVARWARAEPGVRFLIAGPAPQRMSFPGNVEVLGPVPYDELPALLQRARVGMLPLSDDPLNAGRSPMKLYEYLAAGLAVVARQTPGIRAEPPAGLFTYRDSGDASPALRAALAHTSPNTAGADRAQAESWDAKATELTRFLRGLPHA